MRSLEWKACRGAQFLSLLPSHQRKRRANKSRRLNKLKLHKYLTEIKRREICKHKTGRNGKIEASQPTALSITAEVAKPPVNSNNSIERCKTINSAHKEILSYSTSLPINNPLSNLHSSKCVIAHEVRTVNEQQIIPTIYSRYVQPQL